MATLVTDLKTLYDELKVFNLNLSKDSKDRRKNLKINLKKTSDLDEYRNRLANIKLNINVNEANLELFNEIKIYVGSIEKIINDSQVILENRFQSETDALKAELESKMESFNLKTANSLLPCMDGKEETTKKLVDSIAFYAELIKPEDTKLLIKYVLKTRISENAKVRLDVDYDTVDALILDIKRNFITVKSQSTLSNQLHNAQQNGKSLSQFGQNIEQLLSDLTLAQAGSDRDLLKLLRPVNEKIAINSFCNGIRNHELRTIIKARNCPSLKEAINIAIEEEKNKPTPSNIFYFKKRGNFSYKNACHRFPKQQGQYKGKPFTNARNFKPSQFNGTNHNFNCASLSQSHQNAAKPANFNRNKVGKRANVNCASQNPASSHEKQFFREEEN